MKKIFYLTALIAAFGLGFEMYGMEGEKQARKPQVAEYNGNMPKA